MRYQAILADGTGLHEQPLAVDNLKEGEVVKW
jgi:hypothetical protein